MILIPKYQNMLQVSGSLSLILVDANGKVKDERYVPNTIVRTGKEFIIDRMTGDPVVAVMSHMGIGTGTLEVDVDQNNALGAELVNGDNGVAGYDRVVCSVTQETPTSIVYVGVFGGTPNANPTAPAAPTGVPITEAGIFNNGTVGSGVMLCRTKFGVITKVPADTLTINWTISIS